MNALGNLKNLVGFDFSDNFFTGTIPETIGNVSIVSLNVLSNHSPVVLGALEKCDLVRFSFNMLTGKIPNGIGKLW